MSEKNAPRLAAILFSDIFGYSAMMAADEAGTLALVEEHNALLKCLIESNDGKVLKYIGDAILSAANFNQKTDPAAALRILRKLPRPSAHGMFLEGLIHCDAKELDLCISSLEKAVARNPSMGWAWANLAKGYASKSEGKKARSALEKGIANGAKDATLYFYLGGLCQAMKDYHAAETAFRSSIALDSRKAEPHFCLGEVLRELGKNEESAKEFARAAELKAT